MICPKCQGESAVIDSRPVRLSIRRRRKCLSCPYRWSTFEVMFLGEDQYPYRVCKVMVDGHRCHKPAQAKNGAAMCQKHFAAYQRKFFRGEAYNQKRRKRRKMKGMGLK
jgi:hypothetical protein